MIAPLAAMLLTATSATVAPERPPAPFPAKIQPLTPARRAQIETAYRRYVACFNRRDIPCFTNFYDKNVVFVSSALPTMHGPDGIVAFYTNVWKRLSEHVVILGIRYDGEKIIANLQNTLTIPADYPDFVAGPLKKGKKTSSGEVVYTLRNGRIVRIGDGVE